jgi:hypothetical protein
MLQGWRIAAVLALTAVATVAEAARAPALSVPVGTTSLSAPTVSVGPVTTPTVTVPPPPPASVPPAVSNPPEVTVSPVPKVDPPSQPTSSPLGGDSGSGSSGGGGASGGGGTVGGVVNGVKQVLSQESGASGGIVRNSSAGTLAGGAGADASSAAADNSGVLGIFGGTLGGPGGLSGSGGFAGPDGFGGPGSPAVFALRLRHGLSVTAAGTGGVSAFAAAVGALAGCFYALTPAEQRVLTVRSGIDGGPALSRSQVAALFGTTPGAIRVMERNAFRELRGAARTTGCMPVGGVAPASALTAFIGGPFGPIGYVIPRVPPESRGPGSGPPPQTRLASTSFADGLATLEAAGQASMSVLVVIAVMLSAALAALMVEARRSVS